MTKFNKAVQIEQTKIKRVQRKSGFIIVKK